MTNKDNQSLVPSSSSMPSRYVRMKNFAMRAFEEICDSIPFLHNLVYRNRMLVITDSGVNGQGEACASKHIFYVPKHVDREEWAELLKTTAENPHDADSLSKAHTGVILRYTELTEKGLTSADAMEQMKSEDIKPIPLPKFGASTSPAQKALPK